MKTVCTILLAALIMEIGALFCGADDVVPIYLPPGEAPTETSGTFGTTPIDPSSMTDQILTGTMTLPAAIPSSVLTDMTSASLNKARPKRVR